MQALLREELGFQGVILSDDLEMKAVSARIPVPAAAVQAIQAGCDGVLVCSGDVDLQAATLEALVKAVEIRRDQRDAAGRRVQAAARREGTVPRRRAAADVGADSRVCATILGRDEHQAIAAEMASFL